MPATDILNPTPTDPLNPDYGWQKKRPTTQTMLKAASGPAYFREITDVGHQFALNFGTTLDSQKAWADIARLKRYFEQYRGGYFTIIDHEGNGRQFVGRFTAPVEPIPVGHNRWAAQNVLFEEVPGATMVSYPSDWDNEAIFFYTLDDFGDLSPAVDDFANWTLGVDAAGALSPDSQDLQSAVTNAAVRLSYVGWGVQIYAPTGPDRGIANVYVDGNFVGAVDQYAAAPTASASLLTVTDLPLGIYVVKVVCTGTANPSSSGVTIAFDALQVMR
jgi:hypothetical protein